MAKLSFLLGVTDIFISFGQIKTFYHLLLATGSFNQGKPSCSKQVTLTEKVVRALLPESINCVWCCGASSSVCLQASGVCLPSILSVAPAVEQGLAGPLCGISEPRERARGVLLEQALSSLSLYTLVERNSISSCLRRNLGVWLIS